MDNALEAKMGATDNKNATRLAELETRKKQIEDNLAKRTQELRELCLQEADLTGIIPLEMPLEPGESFPSIRRRVGTAYQLPENLLKNSNKDELISDLELQIQLHANLAEAALGLAKETNSSKTLRRKHRSDYEQHKKQCMKLQEQLAILKQKRAEQQQQKQKKKPRNSEQDDNVSVNTNMNESFGKTDLRHSIRSNKHSTSEHNIVEQNYLSGSRYSVRNPADYLEHDINRSDDMGFYRLSINGYKNYMERRENNNISMPYVHETHNHSLHYQPHSPNLSSHSPLMHSPHNFQHSPQLHPRSPQLMYNYSSQHYTNQLPPPHFIRHSSPTTQPTNTNIKPPFYQQSHPIPVQQPANYRQYDGQYRNPHQLQPHQQYEQNVMTAGLGGCWKRSESGEMIWCNQVDSNWQRDKRSGSLDRRKNKRIPKRIPPFVDTKSATISSMPNYPEHVRTASIKSSQIVNRRTHDNRQLVRTQSLGSVGAQTVDSVYASDDNSSFDSNDNRCIDLNNTLRKHKEKEWLETSLDGPIASTPPIVTPLILAPEEKYHPPPPPPPPLTPKPPLEIPAESNPSPRMPDKNIEMFNNNNIPKNCTIVQAGHCKPYHEETKPFEMSDFYKYSTKFKKSPNKQPEQVVKQVEMNSSVQINLNNSFNEVEQYQNLSPMYKCQHSSPGVVETSTSLNTSLDMSHLAISEHFSAEMNAWYKGQEHKISNNNSGETSTKSRSTAATLV